MKFCRLAFFYLFGSLTYIPLAAADDTSDPIFSALAEKAGVVGEGLVNSGYLIAGLGLIVFSFMAIFNKLSWKMLAYIMFSTFVLSVVALVINYASDDKAGTINLPKSTYDGNISGGSNTQANQVSKGKS